MKARSNPPMPPKRLTNVFSIGQSSFLLARLASILFDVLLHALHPAGKLIQQLFILWH